MNGDYTNDACVELLNNHVSRPNVVTQSDDENYDEKKDETNQNKNSISIQFALADHMTKVFDTHIKSCEMTEELDSCRMGEMGHIEITSNPFKAILSWLLIGFIRFIFNIAGLWILTIVIMLLYTPILAVKITCKANQQNKRKKGDIQNTENQADSDDIKSKWVQLRLIFFIMLSMILFYWHFWATMSVYYYLPFKRQIWYGDLIKAFFMELSFEFIIPRIVILIAPENNDDNDDNDANNSNDTNDVDKILELVKSDVACLPKFIRQMFSVILPHKYSHELVDYTYDEYHDIYFNIERYCKTTNRIKVKDQLGCYELMKFGKHKSGKVFQWVSRVFTGLLIAGGLSNTYISFQKYEYEYVFDTACFSIWFIFYTYLLWSYYTNHLYMQFFIYLNQMKILNEIINVNFNDILPKYIKYINQKKNTNIRRKDCTVLLSNSHNIRSWFDIWSEIRRNSRDYFDKQKYFIILVFILLLFSILYGSIRIWTDWYDFAAEFDDIHIAFFGAPALVYTILSLFMLITLLYLSFQFPLVQKQQIRSLTDQHYYINDIHLQITDIALKLDEESTRLNNLKDNLTQVQSILKTIQYHIKVKKISPTIAGLSMDHFLLRLVGTFIIFIITTILAEFIF